MFNNQKETKLLDVKKENDFYKRVLFFSDRASTDSSMEESCRHLNFELTRAESLEHFFQGWHQHYAFLNILDTTLDNDFSTLTLLKDNLTLPPVWLLTEIMPKNTKSGFARMADDFIQKPLSIDSLREAQAFWSASSPLFVQADFENFARHSGEELTARVLSSFLNSLEIAHEQIAASLKERNLQNLEHACHTVKASAKLLGAQAIYNLCLWVEIKFRQNSPISEKFAAQTLQILSRSRQYFEILHQIPMAKILASR